MPRPDAGGSGPIPVNLTILVIGGYGTFGGRLCDLLADEPRLTLIVAGRSLDKAETFCRRPSQARLVPAWFDRDGDLAAQIAALKPHLVVDASGPFQGYGARLYAVVDAALAAGADYIDLADSSAFVLGIGTRDAAAQAAERFVLAGASSFPVLTSAVVRVLAEEFDRVEAIAAGIAPSPYASVGINVVRAIASYAGKPVKLTRGGAPATVPGLIDSRTRTIAVPGIVPLKRIRFALVDVPDLTILPAAWPGIREAWVGAGPLPAILHRALWALAHLVRWRILPSLLPFARLIYWTVNHFRWGEHRGGMFVDVTGTKDGRPVINRWRMIAEGDSGPLIPSMAIEIIVRACLNGRRPAAGARSADGEVTLADYERRFAALGIRTAILRGDPHAGLSP
jgi:hypothetical protein